MRSVSPHQVAEGIVLRLVTAFAIIQLGKTTFAVCHHIRWLKV
jgi:hypothetical protein